MGSPSASGVDSPALERERVEAARLHGGDAIHVDGTTSDPEDIGGGAQESNLPETTFAASRRF